MKITMLTGYFTPELSADTHLNQNLFDDFAAFGADVTLITPFPSRGISDEIQEKFESRRVEEVSKNARILRVGKGRQSHTNLFARGCNLLQKSWQIYKTAKSIETDSYYIVSTPPFLGYAAALLSKKAPVIYKLQDIFPDSLIKVKHLSEKQLAVRFLRVLERFVYKHMAHINAISGDMKETILTRGVPEDKVSVIYDWIDEQKCVPVAREDNILFERFELPRDRFYVSYAGNIGLMQNVETILRAAEILEKTLPEICFVIIGDGAWKAQMDHILREKKLSNVRTFPMQPAEDISHIYSFGDIELVSLKPDVTKIALPSKTWSILSAARPVICEIDLYSKLCAIILENECGLCVSPGDAKALADAILTLYQKSAAEREQMGKNGRAYIEKNLTRAAATKKHYAQIKLLESEGLADVQR